MSDVINNNSGAITVQFNLFHSEKHAEVNGIEMGVLDSGIPYLTGRGLERMCGVTHGPFHRLTSNWLEEKEKPRGKEILKLLHSHGYFEENIFIRTEFEGREVTAFTEPVCLAFLEYYAFVADEKREQAQNAFRTLAKTKFREFIYQAIGYNPNQSLIDSWKHFHDRTDLTMDAAPSGYFGIYREIASMIIPMIRNGVIISDKVVPDISVGLAWSNYWKTTKLSEKYGEPVSYNHLYPDYYPQSKSNPQEAKAYPEEALGAFRAWLKSNYISNKFPKYLLDKTKQGKIQHNTANTVIKAFGGEELPYPSKKIK